MITIESSLTEIQDAFQQIVEAPGKLFGIMRFDSTSITERALSKMLKQKLASGLSTRNAGRRIFYLIGYYALWS